MSTGRYTVALDDRRGQMSRISAAAFTDYHTMDML